MTCARLAGGENGPMSLTASGGLYWQGSTGRPAAQADFPARTAGGGLGVTASQRGGMKAAS